jgi:hypothetical protein
MESQSNRRNIAHRMVARMGDLLTRLAGIEVDNEPTNEELTYREKRQIFSEVLKDK